MIRRSQPAPPAADAAGRPSGDARAVAVGNSVAAQYGDLEGAYGTKFWFTYVANALMMLAFSLLFRYSDFVNLLGGKEWQLGLIAGTGMVGSLSMRLFQGLGIDRYGSKQVWLISNVVFVASLLAHLLVTTVDGPAIYVLRIIYQSSIAGVFGASITYISRRAPLPRVAEIVGTLGTSGFIGMMSGTTLGDWLCPSQRPERWEINRLFLTAAAFGAAALFFAILATRGQAKPLKRRRPPLGWLMRRYHPGLILLMGVATGFGIGLPQIFLRPYVAELGLAGIGVFFWGYTIVAFVTRLCIRRVPEKFGIRPMIIVGIGSLAMAMVLFLVVEQRWQLIIPAFFTGIAHALLFPAIVAGGSTAFPTRFRGLGTTLMLSTIDVGNLVGNPLVGGILTAAEMAGARRYPVMFTIVASILMSLAMYYAFATRAGSSSSSQKKPRLRMQRKRATHSTAA